MTKIIWMDASINEQGIEMKISPLHEHRIIFINMEAKDRIFSNQITRHLNISQFYKLPRGPGFGEYPIFSVMIDGSIHVN